jgi:Fe-S cluster assembly protein SufD
MSTLAPTAKVEPAFGDAFARARASLPGARTKALNHAREDAFARFQRLGIPTVKVEEWKYTNLASLAHGSFALAPAASAKISQNEVAHFRMAGLCEHLLVFVNGRFRADLSDADIADKGVWPAGVRVMPLSTADSEYAAVAAEIAKG